MPSLEVSIIVINYNTYALTRRCLQSVYAKTDGVGFEVILVDNASTECDPGLFQAEFPQIRLIRSDENLGFAGGNNLGISASTGSCILLLNSDTELQNNAVKLAHDRLSEDDSIGVLSGCLLNPDGSIQAQAGRFPRFSAVLFDLFRLSRFLGNEARAARYLGTEADYRAEVEADWVWGTFFMFRRSDLARFPEGKLHEDFFMYFEDVQWCYHFKKVLKKRVLYSPAPRVLHLMGGSDPTARDRCWYFHKVLPNLQRWMIGVRGMAYTRAFLLAKSLFYLSMRGEENHRKAGFYWAEFRR